jgi:universal stress protein A
MLPYQKILCPTDFSEPSYQTIKTAAELTSHFGAKLYVAHVITSSPLVAASTAPITVGAPPAGLNVLLYQQELEAQAKKKLQDIIDQRLSKKLEAIFVLTKGSPSDEIVRIADEEKVDLIVIATYGETGFRHLVFGSVAEKVVRLASCPVLTIPASRKET